MKNEEYICSLRLCLKAYLLSSVLCLFFFQFTFAQQADLGNHREGDTVVVNSKSYIIHKCKKGETAFTIADTYHVTVNELSQANKDAIYDLKKNTVLLIPVFQKKEEVKRKTAENISYKDSIYTIALLIPFNEGANYTPDSTLANGYSLNSSLERETISNLEFYEGAMTAIDSLKANGFKAHIMVIDAFDSSSVILAKLKPEVRNADLILTDLNQNLSGLLSNYSTGNKPQIVSCGFNTSLSLTGNKNAWFASPSSLTQCRQMGAYFAKESAAKNRIIIIKTAYSREIERVDAFYTYLAPGDDKLIVDTTTNPLKSWAGHMMKGKNNIVFLPTTNEAYVSDVINYLKSYAGEFEITLVGLPTWEYFQSVNPEDLQLLHTKIFSAVNISYESPPVEAFRKKFGEKYYTEPSESAFTGYDAMMFFGGQLITHGINFSEYGAGKIYIGLSTKFHFIKMPPLNGFENDYISILQFEGYGLKKLTDK
jgi:LysM repeat protein